MKRSLRANQTRPLPTADRARALPLRPSPGPKGVDVEPRRRLSRTLVDAGLDANDRERGGGRRWGWLSPRPREGEQGSGDADRGSPHV